MPEYAFAREARECFQSLLDSGAEGIAHLKTEPIVFLFVCGWKGAKQYQWGKAQRLTGLTALAMRGAIPDNAYEAANPQDFEAWMITLNHDLWERIATDEEKEQVVYHYLLQCGQDEERIPQLVEPDIIAFKAEVARYGHCLPAAQRFIEALSATAQEVLPFEEGEQP